MIDFSPLWETMEQKGITQYQLLKSGIDITLNTLEKLCRILECDDLNQIVRFHY